MSSSAQLLRLELEDQLLRSELPQFSLCYRGYSQPYAEGWQTTTVDRNSYKLRLELGNYFPDEQPKLYVTSPRILRDYYRCGTINAEGTSHKFHTWENGPGGCVQICHGDDWDATTTCLSVLLKGVLWLEFYENYLRTGETVAEHCH